MVDIRWVEALARRAADIFVKGFIDPLKTVETKSSPSDLVTETDLAIENFLKEEIAKKYPDHKFFCEESVVTGTRLTDDPTWIIDPVDGTTNFVHGLPACAISIAFAEKKDPIIGVIYKPITQEMFSAKRGEGAWMNGQRLSTSGLRVLEDGLVDTGFCISSLKALAQPGTSEERKIMLRELRDCVEHNWGQMSAHCNNLRSTGACTVSMAYIAEGKLDGLALMMVKEWDMAAGRLLVEEAGGRCCVFGGGELGDMSDRTLVAGSTPEFASLLSRILRRPSYPLTDLDHRPCSP